MKKNFPEAKKITTHTLYHYKIIGKIAYNNLQDRK